MKLLRRIEAWTVSAGIVLATAASAQQEQWLQYHTTREGRGYTWLDLTTNPPPNVVLPKFTAAPYFARWATPLDATGGRWLCFDRSRRSGPYDRVIYDRNNNGRLDDEAPIDAARLESTSAYFDPLRFVFKGEDGPITYHLGLRFMAYSDGEVRLLAQGGGWYEGMVNLAGKKRRVALIDGNVNGVFNDLALKSHDCDRIRIGEDKDENADERYLGRLLEVDGQFYQIEVARDGAFIKVKKAENLALGPVRVPTTISQLTAVGENGQFLRKPANGEFSLPAGRYTVHNWAIDRKDSKGAAWKLSGSASSDSAEFEVAAAQATPLQVGEPVLASLSATESKSAVAFGLRLKGSLGESIEILKGTQRPRAPQLLVASAGSSFRATNTFEYG
ncbi:MAG: hypothetical protein HZA90_06575 [Verrucomicrobia bacterium]|nr:hypothetical protein [Verrucomicrobiota bacterium]